MASTPKKSSKSSVRATKPPKANSQTAVAQSTRAPRGASVESKPGIGNVSETAIAEAAYFLWLKRGGSDMTNWLEAEAMLRNRVTRTPA